MFDQADKLRELVRETVKEHAALEPGVPLVAVSGARASIGTSTTAWRLAEELARLGKQVLLVDANLAAPSLATKLGITSHAGIAEVLNGTRSLAEVLEQVTHGLHLLAGSRMGDESPDLNIRALRRLVTELRTVSNHADMVVIDAGFGMSPWVDRMWAASMQVLLVTATDAVSLRDAYSTVKMAPWGDVDGKLRLVVNRCDDQVLAERIDDRFRSTCRQFLGMKLLGSASQLPSDPRLARDSQSIDTAQAYRQSIRLLAADMLSHSLSFVHRTTALGSRYTATSQAASLVSQMPAQRRD